MYITSHFIIPVIVARQVNLQHARRRATEPLSTKEIFLIGLAGTLPDLLSPHIWISERHTAYSHSLAALLLFSIISFIFLNKRLKLYSLLVLAYTLHLFFDYISGGVPLLLPFSEKIFYQFWLLPPIHWIIADIILLLMIYFQSWYRRFRLKDRKAT